MRSIFKMIAYTYSPLLYDMRVSIISARFAFNVSVFLMSFFSVYFMII